MGNVISTALVATRIFVIRGKKVILDRDLAGLYGVSTKTLNQAVKRNVQRFPHDFMFKLNSDEKNKVVTNCDHLKVLRFSYQLPYAFTEQGVAMLSSVLNSERAIKVNIQIMRAFVRLRYILSSHKSFEIKLEELEKRLESHDVDIHAIFEALRQLMGLPDAKQVIKGFAHT